MTQRIKKAVFPVAGLGTRFLPVTKANPKEMLPIVDKPLIQFAVEEAISAGMTQLIFVTSSSKRAIEDHFDTNYELESKLEERGQDHLLSMVRNIIPKGVACIYIRQHEPLGLGHAVYCAKSIVGNEPFAVLLADDLIDEQDAPNSLTKMVKLYQQTKSSVIAIEKVVAEDVSKYGIVDMGQPKSHDQSNRIKSIIEKPKPEQAPSQWAVVGRYVFSPSIFKTLEGLKVGKNGEMQLTDAISKLLSFEAVYSYPITGRRYDCGSQLGYLQATTNYALKRPELNKSFRSYLEKILRELP